MTWILFDHLLPVIITVLIIALLIMYYIGRPYLHYVSLMEAADTQEGKEDLAKHLAHKTGGKRIHVDGTWQSFLPAAQDLHTNHQEKKNKLTD